jgi:hypothetical protein
MNRIITILLIAIGFGWLVHRTVKKATEFDWTLDFTDPHGGWWGR